jgi:hypothetical protein
VAHHQLDQKTKADALLQGLREVMKNPRWIRDAENRGFLDEAEALIEHNKKAGAKP